MTNTELIAALRWCSIEDNEYCVDEDYRCPYFVWDKSKDDCKSEMMVAAADALEAAEQRIAELEAQLPKEGEWKKILQNGDGTSDYECSACLGIIMNVPDDDEHPLCSFCQNCGAKMDGADGERKDDEQN